MITPPQGDFVAAGLCNYIPEWEKVTKDPISLQAIRGTKILLKSTCPLRYDNPDELDRRRVDLVLDKAIQDRHSGGPKGHQGVPETCLHGTWEEVHPHP